MERIAAALRLNAAELAYFQSLVTGDLTSSFDYEADVVSDTVAETLASITTMPAFVIGPRLDHLAVNAHTRALFRYPEERDPIFDNLVARMFLSPRATEIYGDWESSALRTVAKFRRAYGRHIGNASFGRLVARLSAESAAFARLWNRHEVAWQHEAVTDSIVAIEGSYRFRLQAFDIPDSHEQTLVVMLPAASADSALLARLPL